jgi:tetratricopeptide (TPR) repeat protein
MATDARDGSIAARLRATLARLKAQDPFQILGVPFTAEAEAVRQAFLSATKRHHPNRLAREGVEVRELATEVFLLIRGAYEQLSNEATRNNWRARVAPAAPLRVTNPSAFPAPRPAASSPPAPTPPPRLAQPAAPEPIGPRATVPVGIPPAPWASPSAPPPAAASVPTPIEERPAGPVILPRRRDVARTRPHGIVPPVDPVQAMLDAVKSRGKRFDDAVASLNSGKYQEAREAFFKLASEDPQNRRYRIQLHIAWGHEHAEAGRGEDALREYQRALNLDPTLRDVAAAVKKLEEQKKSGGIFSKFFGR